MHLRYFIRIALISVLLLLPVSVTLGQSCGSFSVDEHICLSSPAANPGDIWIRDANGIRTGEEWPDKTAATIGNFSSNCSYSQVHSSYGSGWVSAVVLSSENTCSSNGDDSSALCSGSSDCETMARNYALKGKTRHSYSRARKYMFQEIDNIGGAVITVYSRTRQSVPSSGLPNANVVNTEHTWPQSKLGSAYSEARTDLYHLFPTLNSVNSKRANYPFTDCPGGGEKTYLTCNHAFEPPHVHKGVVARAMFYVAVAYDLNIAAPEESILREWHRDFPVTAAERSRAAKIRNIQGNRNPFIDNPSWVNLITDF